MNGWLKKRKLYSLLVAMGFGLATLALFMLLLTDTALGDFTVQSPLSAPVAISQVGPDTVTAGGVMTYTITVVNTSGDTLAAGWELRDTWTTSLYNDTVKWWTERGALASFGGYIETPAVLSVTHMLRPEVKRGEAVFTMAALAPGASVQVVFSTTVSPALQPSLKEHKAQGAFGEIVGPTSMENSVIAVVSGYTTAEANLVSTMVIGPVLRLWQAAEGEVAGPTAGRVGRVLTYTLALQNLEYDGILHRPDAIPARNLVVSVELPESVGTAYLNGGASVPGVNVQYSPGPRIVQWVYPLGYELQPGPEVLYMTFTLRIPPDHLYNPNVTINTPAILVLAQADDMPHHPANAVADLKVKVLGPFDKIVETATLPKGADETFANRVITYTLTFYNPFQEPIYEVMIEDALPTPFRYLYTVDGLWPTEVRADDRIMEWHNLAVASNDLFQVTFAVTVPAQTLPTTCAGKKYTNAMTATSESASSPAFDYIGNNNNAMTEVKVMGALILAKTVLPGEQIPGQLVTYTLSLENKSDQVIPAFTLLTDTLPMENAKMYFAFHAMADEEAPPYAPTTVISNVVSWHTVPAIAPGQKFMFDFGVVVDGIAEKRYSNNAVAYNATTAICPLVNKAPVKVVSPIKIFKTALPATIVQGELITYQVTLQNDSPVNDYDLHKFEDNLTSVLFTDYLDGDSFYVYTETLPYLLEAGQSWEHDFVVEATGSGLGTPWCIARADPNKPLEQAIGMVSIIYSTGEPPVTTTQANVAKLAPVTVIPHISLYQEMYPNPVAIRSTAVLTLTLHDNRPEPTQTTGIRLAWPNPAGIFSVTESHPPYSSVLNDVYYWDNLVLDEETVVTLTLLAPFTVNTPTNLNESKDVTIKAEVVAIDDPAICIPPNSYSYKIRRGIEIEKVPNLKIISPYNEIIYTLRAKNLTGAPVAGVVLTDVLPYGWEYLEWVSGPEPDAIDPPVWYLDTIPAQGFIEMRFKVRSYTMVGTNINLISGTAPINLGYSAKYTENVGVMILSGIGFFKEVGPPEVDAGNTVVYTLTMYNGTNVDLKNIVVVDKLPPGFSFVNMVYGTYPLTHTEAGQEIVTWNVAQELGKTKSLVFVFRARAHADLPSGYYFNEATGEAYSKVTGEPREVPATGPTARVRVYGEPTVLPDKTVAPSDVRAGEEVTYTITLFNEANENLTLIVTDTLPVGFEFVATVDSPAATLIPGTPQQVVWYGLPIGPLETLTLAFRARADALIETGSYYNHVQVKAGNFELPISAPLAPVNVMQRVHVDAQISKWDGVEVAEAGDTLIYTIAYTNAADSEVTLHNVVITETVAPFEYVDFAGGEGWEDLGNGQYLYEVGDLAPGASGVVTFEVELATIIPDDILSFRNEAEIGYTTVELSADINPADNHAVDVNVLRALFKTGAPEAVNAGGEVVYTITLHNSTEQAWTDILITDTLPSGFTFKQMHQGPGPVFSSGPLIWSLPPLPAGESLALVFRATVGAGVSTGEYYNQVAARVTAAALGVGFEVPATGLTAPIVVRGRPDVVLSKSVTPDTVAAGQEVTYTITFINYEAVTLTVALTDTLPAMFSFLAPITPSTFITIPGAREQVVWSDLTLPAEGELEVRFRAQVDPEATERLRCNDVAAQLDGWFLYAQQSVACVFVTAPVLSVDAQVSLFDGLDEVYPGDLLTYTLHYTNSEFSQLPLENIVLTATVTPAEAFSEVVAWQAVAPGVYTLNVGTLPPGTADSVQFEGRINPALSPAVDSIIQHVEIGYTTSGASQEENPDDNHATDSNAVIHERDVALYKAASASSILVGGEVLYTLTLTSAEELELPVVLTDVLPSGFHFVEALSAGTPLTTLLGAQEQLVWSDLTLPANGTLDVVFRARVAADTPPFGSYCNTAEARIDRFLRQAEVCVAVVGTAAGVDARVSVNDGLNEVILDEVIVYTVLYTNALGSQLALHNVVLTATLTPPEALVDVDAAWTQQAPGVYVRTVAAVLNPGASGSAQLTGRVNPALSSAYVTMTNRVDIGYTTEAPSVEINPNDNTAADTNLVIHDLTVAYTKTAWPEIVSVGQDVTYTITLTNPLEKALTLIVTDTFPNDFWFRAAIDPPVADPRPGVPQVVVWRNLSIAPLGTRTITFRARTDEVEALGNYCNRVQVQVNDTVLPISGPLACVEVADLIQVDAQISKADGVEAAQAGQTLVYTIHYTNDLASDTALQNVVITETLTPFAAVASAGGVGWTDLGAGVYRYNVAGSLAPGTSGQVNFTVQLQAPLPENIWNLRNEAEIGYTTDGWSVDINPANNRAVDVNVLRALSKTVAPATVVAGNDVTYTLTLYNSVEQAWTNIRITDTLPAGFTFAQMLGGPVPVVNGGQLVWSPPDVAAGGTLTLVFRATVNRDVPPGIHHNTVAAQVHAAGGVQFSLPPTGPTAPVTVSAPPPPEMDIHKSVTPQAIEAGQEVTYTITLTNAEDFAMSVVLTDVLPSWFHFVAALTPETPTIIPGSRERLVWSGLTVAPAGTLELGFRAQVNALAPSFDDYCNEIEASVDGHYYPRRSFACVEVLGTLPGVDAQVSLFDGVSEVSPGDLLTYTIHYTNAANSELPLHNVVLTATLTPATALVEIPAEWTPVASGVYIRSVGTLEPGEADVVLLTGRVNPELPTSVLLLTHQVEIGYTTPEPASEYNLENNQAVDVNVIQHSSGPVDHLIYLPLVLRLAY